MHDLGDDFDRGVVELKRNWCTPTAAVQTSESQPQADLANTAAIGADSIATPTRPSVSKRERAAFERRVGSISSLALASHRWRPQWISALPRPFTSATRHPGPFTAATRFSAPLRQRGLLFSTVGESPTRTPINAAQPANGGPGRMSARQGRPPKHSRTIETL
jgi:hypothetical protein